MPLSFFKTGTYSVARPASGSYVLGRWVPGSSASFNIDAAIQPPSSKELARALQLLPDGFSIDGSKVLYTTTEVRCGSNPAESDLITIGSETWRVLQVSLLESWEISDDYYKALIMKVDVL